MTTVNPIGIFSILQYCFFFFLNSNGLTGDSGEGKGLNVFFRANFL